MNLLDAHAEKLKRIISKFGRPVILTTPDGLNTYPVTMIWNDVEHALKIDGLADKPMGAKSSLYIDRDSLDILGIDPGNGWKATGSPSKYDDDKTYLLEIPKLDKQLPGALFFLSIIDTDASSLPSPESQA